MAEFFAEPVSTGWFSSHCPYNVEGEGGVSVGVGPPPLITQPRPWEVPVNDLVFFCQFLAWSLNHALTFFAPTTIPASLCSGGVVVVGFVDPSPHFMNEES